jgi:hypothetical protein
LTISKLVDMSVKHLEKSTNTKIPRANIYAVLPEEPSYGNIRLSYYLREKRKKIVIKLPVTRIVV